MSLPVPKTVESRPAYKYLQEAELRVWDSAQAVAAAKAALLAARDPLSAGLLSDIEDSLMLELFSLRGLRMGMAPQRVSEACNHPVDERCSSCAGSAVAR